MVDQWPAVASHQHQSMSARFTARARTQLWLLPAKTAGLPSPLYGAETRMATLSAMPAVSSHLARSSRIRFLTCLGLYYKLHGAHRPVTMKKPMIKRRKRVIPASQETADGASTEPADSPSPSADASTERGSINPDGSVNLGVRQRPETPLTLVPEAVLRRNRPPSPLHPGNLTQYHSSPTSQPYHLPHSLTNENRLPPLTSITVPTDRRSSLSPASFLSPSRKRSISSIDMEFLDPSDNDNPKRLSSIKSLLNHEAGPVPGDDPAGQRLQPMRSHGVAGQSGGHPHARNSPHDSSGESNRLKAERRLALEREAERIRGMLAANEEELAELKTD